MAGEILIIGDKIDPGSGRLVLSVGFSDPEKREALMKESNESVIQRYKGKPITVRGKQYTLHTQILGVQVSSSLANFKNIFFEIAPNDRSDLISELDEVHVDI